MFYVCCVQSASTKIDDVYLLFLYFCGTQSFNHNLINFTQPPHYSVLEVRMLCWLHFRKHLPIAPSLLQDSFPQIMLFHPAARSSTSCFLLIWQRAGDAVLNALSRVLSSLLSKFYCHISSCVQLQNKLRCRMLSWKHFKCGEITLKHALSRDAGFHQPRGKSSLH